MRLIITILSFITSIYLYGQNSNAVYQIPLNEPINWDYQDFIDNGIVRVQAFNYELTKDGKEKKDSTKLFDQKIDLDSHLVQGINCELNYTSHGKHYRTWYNFKTYYDQKGNMVRRTHQPISTVKKKEFGQLKWEVNIYETTYQYDERNLMTKEIDNHIKHSYSISEYTKDTSHFHTEHPNIYEYEYNQQGKEVKKYHTDDSTRYLSTKSYTSDTSSSKCFDCDPRYLDAEKEYDKHGNLTKWIWYTRKSRIHSKKYYFYNELNQLTKQIDSTGWYHSKTSETQPSLRSIKTFVYRNGTPHKITEIRGNKTSISEFDEKGNLVKNCSLVDDQTDNCTEYNYVYENELLMEIHSLPDQKTIFDYNDEGLLLETKEYEEDQLIVLLKYHYEKGNSATNE